MVEEELAEEYWEGGASVLLSIITSNHVFFIEEDVDSKVSGDFHIYPCFRHWCLR